MIYYAQVLFSTFEHKLEDVFVWKEQKFAKLDFKENCENMF